MNQPQPISVEWMYAHHHQPQPTPMPNDEEFVQDLVISDIVARQRAAESKYHTKGLQPFNGRNIWVDYYQEQLDALLYFKSILIWMDEVSDLSQVILRHPQFQDQIQQMPDDLATPMAELFSLLASYKK